MMAVTSAKYTSRDNSFRMEVEYDNGDPVYYRRDRHELEMAEVEAEVTPTAFVNPKRAPLELQSQITGKFWEKVAAHFGVPVDRAQTQVGIMGAPAAVQTLWSKATALMDGPDINEDDINDDSNWT